MAADEKSSQVWAGKRKLESELRAQVRNMRIERSAIRLLWGWFGAGKTHSLYYLKKLCDETKNVLYLYTEFSENCASFLDLYKSFVPRDTSSLGRLYEGVLARERYNKDVVKDKICSEMPDLQICLEGLTSGNRNQVDFAKQWLQGQKLPRWDLSKNGYIERIESDDQAIRTIRSLVSLVGASEEFVRIVWAIDEFQKIDSLKKKAAKTPILEGLYRVFNGSPNRLSLYFAFSTMKSSDFKPMVSKELAERIGTVPPLEVKLLSKSEAKEFVADLLRIYRCRNSSTSDAWHPFDEECVDLILSHIESKGYDMKPRTINDLLDQILIRYDPALADGSLSRIGKAEASSVLSDTTARDDQKE
ncbi:MAG: hypothetical protein JRN20_13420 [Nitrososphaerota archaeon]|nr:hypothetical protein [Nitrososphaerota archaeon]MDG6923727.1 hypothetical protein [Nitrososphaerota archaeon]